MPVFAGLVRVGQMAWWEVRRMARGEMQRVARGQESWVARGEMSWVAGRQVALVARLNRGQVTGAGDIHGRMSAAHHALWGRVDGHNLPRGQYLFLSVWIYKINFSQTFMQKIIYN